jgi:hypothetical protein
LFIYLLAIWSKLKSREGSIKDAVFENHKLVTEKHKEHLTKVTETIMWLGKQGLALRGHDESMDSQNRGNFLELLELRSVDCPALKKYLQIETFKYTSPDVQNELIEIIGQLILKPIIAEINATGVFCLIIDGTQDISVHEQISFCVRYVDQEFNIRESFLGFWDSPRSDAASLFGVVQNVFSEVGLSFSMLRGQCYDGASTMAGQHTGLATRILELQPLAPFTHCWNHQFNLILVHACSPVKHVRNTLNTVQSVYKFFCSHKRQDIFRSKQAENSEDRVRTLKSHCDTRWSSWLAAVRDLRATVPSIVQSLDFIDDNDRTSSGCEAGQLSKAVQSFRFLFCLEFLFKIFSITDQFSNDLQSATIDVSTARCKAKIVYDSMQNLRQDGVFESLWSLTKSQAQLFDVDEPTAAARNPGRPARFDDCSQSAHTFRSPADEYKATIFYPIIDHVCGELMERFLGEKNAIVENLHSVLVSYREENLASADAIAAVSAFYKLDLEALKAELHVLCSSSEIKELVTVQQLSKHLIQRNLCSWFPLLCNLIRVYLSLPVTSVASERSFSQLKMLKDEKRSTMLETRLRGLSLMKIEKIYLQSVPISEVVKIFVNKKERRQKFS